MTDIMKLADTYWASAGPDHLKTRDALQSAIEALQAENERLKRELEISKLDAKEWHSQADALQAKLDELTKQEPVAHQFQTEIDKKWHNFIDDEHYLHTLDDGRWLIRDLFAEPKALEHLTDEAITSIASSVDADWYKKQTDVLWVIDFARAIEAAHGIGSQQ